MLALKNEQLYAGVRPHQSVLRRAPYRDCVNEQGSPVSFVPSLDTAGTSTSSSLRDVTNPVQA